MWPTASAWKGGAGGGVARNAESQVPFQTCWIRSHIPVTLKPEMLSQPTRAQPWLLIRLTWGVFAIMISAPRDPDSGGFHWSYSYLWRRQISESMASLGTTTEAEVVGRCISGCKGKRNPLALESGLPGFDSHYTADKLDKSSTIWASFSLLVKKLG